MLNRHEESPHVQSEEFVIRRALKAASTPSRAPRRLRTTTGSSSCRPRIPRTAIELREPRLRDPGPLLRDAAQRVQSHKLAEMLAHQEFPGIKTDSIFNEGRFNGDQFETCPAQGNWLRAAGRGGRRQHDRQVLLPGLADFPGDPTAWVADRGDVLRVVARQEPQHRATATSRTRPARSSRWPTCAIADDIIERRGRRTSSTSNPGADREEVRDAGLRFETGRSDPNPLLVDDYIEADIEATATEPARESSHDLLRPSRTSSSTASTTSAATRATPPAATACGRLWRRTATWPTPTTGATSTRTAGSSPAGPSTADQRLRDHRATIQYQGTGGTYPSQVTLTGAMWPDWAAEGTYLRVRPGATHRRGRRMKSRDRPDARLRQSTPACDLPAGTPVPPLPRHVPPARGLHRPGPGPLRAELRRHGLHATRGSGSTRTATSSPRACPQCYTITGDKQYPGRLMLRIFPWPYETKTIDFIYKRRPRPLRIYKVSAVARSTRRAISTSATAT